MLVKRHRFHGYGSLNAVYKRGQNVRADYLSLRIAKRPDGRPHRVAVVVSRKVSKSAVVRNRIRRRVYEVVRLSDASLLEGNDLIFTAWNDRLAELDPEKLTAMIQDLLQKAVTQSR